MTVPRNHARGAEPSSDPSLAAFIPALRRFFERRAPRGQAEDLVQEVLLNLQARKAQQPVVNLQAYLFAIAPNVLAKHRRREAQAREGLDLLAIDGGEADAICPERALIGTDRLRRALAAIQQMPVRTRDIFLLHRFEELTYAAIGRRYGISISAVEKHIMAALRVVHSAVETGP